MASDPSGAPGIPPGTPVHGAGGAYLGTVREAYPHYLLVDQEGEHDDLTIPIHAIVSYADGRLEVSVDRGSASAVDHEETVHHQREQDRD
jgi:hypothetical protein